jgi:hypothetical protein
VAPGIAPRSVRCASEIPASPPPCTGSRPRPSRIWTGLSFRTARRGKLDASGCRRAARRSTGMRGGPRPPFKACRAVYGWARARPSNSVTRPSWVSRGGRVTLLAADSAAAPGSWRGPEVGAKRGRGDET